jgi:hypothetical protein
VPPRALGGIQLEQKAALFARTSPDDGERQRRRQAVTAPTCQRCQPARHAESQAGFGRNPQDCAKGSSVSRPRIMLPDGLTPTASATSARSGAKPAKPYRVSIRSTALQISVVL